MQLVLSTIEMIPVLRAKIGKSNVIGAGALILGDTEDNKVYMQPATEVSRVPSNRLRGI